MGLLQRFNGRLGGAVLCAALVAAYAAIVGPARAQKASDATAPAYRMAYQSAMKCYVANGIIAGDQRDAGDSGKAALYERKAKEAFDLAFQAGRKVGLADTRIRGDLDRAQARELPILMRDDGYFRKTAGECKALGLM